MKPILIAMLGAQLFVLVIIACAVMGIGPGSDRRTARWWRFVGPAVIGAAASWEIADHHAADVGAQIVDYGGFLLLGVALMLVFLAVRGRRVGEP